MRRAAKVDANQGEIVSALRSIPGVSVLPLHAVGKGCPDILVGYRGFNLLLEIKDGSRPPSERTLTGPQKKFHAEWTGQKAVIECIEEALWLLDLEPDTWQHIASMTRRMKVGVIK